MWQFAIHGKMRYTVPYHIANMIQIDIRFMQAVLTFFPTYTNRYDMIELYYWSTLGWVRYGRFETMYQAKHYTLKYPKKQWKMITAIQMDNIILPDDQMTKTQQDEDFDFQELPLNCIGTA